MSDHNECVVKLSTGELDWYDLVWDVHVEDNGDLFIQTALYDYDIKEGDWVDYKVRPYDPETTYNWGGLMTHGDIEC